MSKQNSPDVMSPEEMRKRKALLLEKLKMPERSVVQSTLDLMLSNGERGDDDFTVAQPVPMAEAELGRPSKGKKKRSSVTA